MTTQTIFPVNPMLETSTRCGYKAWVTHYAPATNKWVGYDNEGCHRVWDFEGRCPGNVRFSVVAVPDIPPEARTPEIGEVWADSSGRAVLLMQALDLVGGPGWCVAVLNNSCLLMRNECSHNLVPWPKGVPHGFEEFRVAVANKLHKKS